MLLSQNRDREVRIVSTKMYETMVPKFKLSGFDNYCVQDIMKKTFLYQF